jgi:hypothetical protein
MPQAAGYSFAYHQMLVLFAGAVCLFGTWVGMRHFARTRATAGSTRGVVGLDLHLDSRIGPVVAQRI